MTDTLIRTDPDLVALVDAAVAGDRAAFAALYDLHLITVYRFVLHRVRHPELAEDLTSETFTRALRRMPSFTWSGGGFQAWLITIARNLIADHFKSSSVQLETPTGEMADADKFTPSGGDPAEVVVDAIDTAARDAALRRIIGQLSPEQRQCIELRFLRDQSITQTAALMDKHEGAVKTLQYRATRALARRLIPTPTQEATP